jgi:hypothetical protein
MSEYGYTDHFIDYAFTCVVFKSLNFPRYKQPRMLSKITLLVNGPAQDAKDPIMLTKVAEYPGLNIK